MPGRRGPKKRLTATALPAGAGERRGHGRHGGPESRLASDLCGWCCEDCAQSTTGSVSGCPPLPSPSPDPEADRSVEDRERRGGADGRTDRCWPCGDRELALVAGQCGPCLDPLRVTAASNTWCHLLRQKGVDLRALCVLRDRIRRGTIYYPWTAGYDAHRLVFNKRISRFPGAIVMAESVGDVRRALRWARQHNVQVAVRAGGHSFEGFSLAEGLVVDISRMDAVEVDAEGRVARAQAGALIGPAYAEAQRHGLTMPAGTCANVGLAGLTLGGGLGFLMRRWGLACDGLLGAQFVLADGSVVEVRADDPDSPHADLLWAARGGGGGNFAIATRLDYRLHALSRVVLFEIAFAWSDDGTVARIVDAWQDWAPRTDDRLTCQLSLNGRAGGVVFHGQFAGDDRGELARLLSGPLREMAGSAAVARLDEWLERDKHPHHHHHDHDHHPHHRHERQCRELSDVCDGGVVDESCHGNGDRDETGHRAKVTSLWVREMSFLDAARHYSGRNVLPYCRRAKSQFVYEALSPCGLRDLVVWAGRAPVADPERAGGGGGHVPNAVWLQAMGGAVARGPRGACGDSAPATAFAHRRALYWIEWVGAWNDPLDEAVVAQWLRDAYAAAVPHTSGYCYVNFPDLDLGLGAEALHAFYGPSARLERLQRVKSRYDPDWFFSMPQGVPPVGFGSYLERPAYRAARGITTPAPGECCADCARSLTGSKSRP